MSGSMNSNSMPTVEPVQQTFASMLIWLVRIGLGLLFVTFVIYAAGLVPSAVPLADVPDLWHLGATEYAAETDLETGWAWVRSLDQGRMLVFAALVLFPAGTMILIAVTVVLYLRQKVPAYALIALLELAVLVVAATGVFATGH
jgi:hypothetical protein